MEQSREFEFNTAITALTEDGSFDKKAHAEAIKPVVARIMSNDGLVSCFIARYGVTVRYLPNVTDFDTIERIVKEAVAWAAEQEGLFPLRGDKTPTATYDRPAPLTPSPIHQVDIRFNTSCIAYPVTVGKEDVQEAFDREVKELAERMTRNKAVTGYNLYLHTANLRYDSRLVTREEIVAHLTKVFTDAAAEKAGFFPYASDSEPLELTFSD